MRGDAGEVKGAVEHDREIRLLKHHVAEMAELAVGMVADGTRALLNGDTDLRR